MVIGGQASYGELTYTTEIYDVTSGNWSFGPDVPVLHNGDCAVSLNETHKLLIEGSTDDACFMFKPEDESFDEVPCPASNHGSFYSCTRMSDGRIAVMGGGHTWDSHFDDVEYFDPETLTWSKGQSLEEGIKGAALVADGDDLLLLGGESEQGLLDKVYRLRNDEWELIELKLNAKQMYFPAFPLDTSAYGC